MLAHLRLPFALFLALLSFTPRSAAAGEIMCDPSFQDCRAILLNYIRNERVGIDLAMLFMEDDLLADAIIARHQAGVRVRALVEPRRNPTTPKNAVILDRLRAAGIPMRSKQGGGMLHWKFMTFDQQNVVQFSAANYTDYYFIPVVPYSNYTDEGIFFTDDPPLVDTFRRRFDDAWVDPSAFVNYANLPYGPSRIYPMYPMDPSLSFVPFEDFATRSVPLYDAEQHQIDSVMYKVTEPRHAEGLIRAAKRGLTVRLITEGERYRNPANMWQAYYIDKLYMAGVQIRDRAHEGFLHQKSTLLYGQGMTIFGSSNWTIESNQSQYEHNYFTGKLWFFNWFKDNFERKWTNRTGNVETAPFVPLPPGPVTYVSPAQGATGVATTGATLRWHPGTWGHIADIYFGTSPNPPLVAGNLAISAADTNTYRLPTLAAGTTYYWRIVNKTIALKETAGAVQSFTTAGSTTPSANVVPAASLTSPANGSAYTAPATISMAASASDSDGTIARVEFYNGTTLLASDATAPYQFTWSGVAAGSYTLSARAVDNAGGVGNSGAVNVTVSTPANSNPTVSLTTPANGAAYTAPATIAIAASASDSDGTIARVDFYNGSTLLGSDAAAPYQFTWNGVAAGSYTLTARAFDNSGGSAGSGAVNVTVSAPANAAPSVSLTSPANGSTYTAPATISIGASASDTDGTITRVDFYNGSTLLGSDTTSPYQYSWSNVGAGGYALSARAIDDDGATRTSTTVNVTVSAASQPQPPALPSPWQGHDVGAVGVSGSASASNGLYTVRGAGADVWGASDAFHFVWQRLSGDVDVVARVASIEYVHAWVKAGVMIRAGLTADAPHAFMLASPGKGLAFQRRLAAGGVSTHTSGGLGSAPVWVKLERRGNTITAYQSPDGTTWTTVGRDTFTMGAEVYVGLAVSSHDVSRTAAATFDQVAARATATQAVDTREIVLHTTSVTRTAGNWRMVADGSAASGQRAWNPDAGAAKVVTAAAAPSDYIELTFNAEAGRAYRLWIRGKAEADLWSNDSVHVQFSDSLDESRAAAYRIGTTSSAEYNLESCKSCGVSGWGWEDNGWGVGVLGPAIYFATTGPQTIRIQSREDGVSIDQIVLSSGTYLTTAPGAAKNDTTILPRR